MGFKSVAFSKAVDTTSLQGLGKSLLDIAQWAYYEFNGVQAALGSTEADTIWNKAPPKPRRGTYAYADGTNWNPGAGEGPYYYNGSTWVPLGATASLDAMMNIAVNGNMEVSQANGTSAITASGYAVDGWLVAATGPAFSAQQVTDAPPGYAASLKVSITTADASPAATDFLQIYSPIEGYRISQLAFGTASAASVSLGFWVKANRTGTYAGSVRNGATSRSYVFNFTVNTSATWQYVTVAIPGDTAGTWPNTNATGLFLGISIMTGSAYLAAAGVWVSGNLSGTIGSINGAAATTDYMQVTGIVMLPGIELPSSARAPFIMRPYDQELLICKRYFQRIGGDVADDFVLGANAAIVGGVVGPCFIYPVEMRVAPSAALAGATWANSGNISAATVYTGTRSLYWSFTTTTTGPAYYATNVGSWFKLDARM